MESESTIDSVVGDRINENVDWEEDEEDEEVMLPSPTREGNAKVDSSLMSAEFGPHGEKSGVDSMVGRTADPRNWTESETVFAPGRIAEQGIPEPQYEGEYPDGFFEDENEDEDEDAKEGSVEDAEEPDGNPEDNPEEESKHFRRKGSSLYAEQVAWSESKELEELTQARVHKKGERQIEVTLNKKQAEKDKKCHEEMKEYDSRPEYQKILDDYDPREHLTQDQMKEVYKYSVKVLEQVGGISRCGIAKRIAMKMAEPIETPSEEKEVTLDATGETITMKVGSVDIPLDYDGSFKDPFADPISPFNAAVNVKEELLYELPRTAEGVSQYHNNASIEGRITQMWEPKNNSQSHAFNMVDENGETIKVVIWEKADGKKYGFDSYNLTHLDWNDHTGIPDLREGDLIHIYDGKPSQWQDTLNIACTQDTLISVQEREISIEERTGNVPSGAEYTPQNPTFQKDYKSITDDYSDDVTPLSQKRYRPVSYVKARHGDFDHRDPDDQPPVHPGKRAGISETGWRFCTTWTFRKSMCPDWWCEKENVMPAEEYEQANETEPAKQPAN